MSGAAWGLRVVALLGAAAAPAWEFARRRRRQRARRGVASLPPRRAVRGRSGVGVRRAGEPDGTVPASGQRPSAVSSVSKTPASVRSLTVARCAPAALGVKVNATCARVAPRTTVPGATTAPRRSADGGLGPS